MWKSVIANQKFVACVPKASNTSDSGPVKLEKSHGPPRLKPSESGKRSIREVASGLRQHRYLLPRKEGWRY